MLVVEMIKHDCLNFILAWKRVRICNFRLDSYNTYEMFLDWKTLKLSRDHDIEKTAFSGICINLNVLMKRIFFLADNAG